MSLSDRPRVMSVSSHSRGTSRFVVTTSPFLSIVSSCTFHGAYHSRVRRLVSPPSSSPPPPRLAFCASCATNASRLEYSCALRQPRQPRSPPQTSPSSVGSLWPALLPDSQLAGGTANASDAPFTLVSDEPEL